MNLKIGNREIGEGKGCFIIAELSANHNQSLEIAIKTIKAAKEAGADAIKLQTYTPDTITIDCNNEYFQIKQGTIWDGTNLYRLYQKAFTPWDWHYKLMETAAEIGLICFSSPFDKTAVDFLEKLNVPAYKIASFEITDIPLIEYVASKGKPVIISTGIAEEEDIQLAVETCRLNGNNNIVLLKCTSAYPASPDEINLRSMDTLRNYYNLQVGLSDHTNGIAVPVAAVAMGAVIVEKHFILDRKIGGPDASFSLEPVEFKEMVDSIRIAERSLGRKDLLLSERAKKSREHSRSLFVVRDIQEGELITEENVRSIRPGFGLHPKYYNDILGKKSKFNLKKGTPFSLDFLA